MRYYKCVCIGGHCGGGKERELVFYFQGNDYYEVYSKAVSMPMVKKHRTISSLQEISKKEYVEGRKENAYHKFDKRRN